MAMSGDEWLWLWMTMSGHVCRCAQALLLSPKMLDMFSDDAGNMDPCFLKHLVLRLQLSVFSIGDTIIEEGDIGVEVYFLSHGTVEVIVRSKAVAKLSHGDCFGEIALLVPGTKRTASIVAACFCECQCLSRNDLFDCLQHFPDIDAKIRRSFAGSRTRPHATPVPVARSARRLCRAPTAAGSATRCSRRHSSLPLFAGLAAERVAALQLVSQRKETSPPPEAPSRLRRRRLSSRDNLLGSSRRPSAADVADGDASSGEKKSSGWDAVRRLSLTRCRSLSGESRCAVGDSSAPATAPAPSAQAAGTAQPVGELDTPQPQPLPNSRPPPAAATSSPLLPSASAERPSLIPAAACTTPLPIVAPPPVRPPPSPDAPPIARGSSRRGEVTESTDLGTSSARVATSSPSDTSAALARIPEGQSWRPSPGNRMTA